MPQLAYICWQLQWFCYVPFLADFSGGNFATMRVEAWPMVLWGRIKIAEVINQKQNKQQTEWQAKMTEKSTKGISRGLHKSTGG